LARDGFGVQRDDENGNYVDIDDALEVLHRYAAPQAASLCRKSRRLICFQQTPA